MKHPEYPNVGIEYHIGMDVFKKIVMVDNVEYAIWVLLRSSDMKIVMRWNDEFCYSVKMNKDKYQLLINGIKNNAIKIGKPHLKLFDTTDGTELVLEQVPRELDGGCCSSKYYCHDWSTILQYEFEEIKFDQRGRTRRR